MSVFQKLLHAGEGKRLKAVQAIVPLVSAFEPEVEKLSDEQLIARTAEFKGRVDRAKSGARDPDHELELIHDALDDLLPEAFATVREAGKRVLGQRHFDVQVMGGAALHLGWVAEMKTGEGKTLVATLPCYLNALSGRGVHLITVNDYLARFQAEWMGRLHSFLGLKVGTIVPDDATPTRSAGSTTAMSRTARTTSSASTTCATTWSSAGNSRCSAAIEPSSSSRTSTRSSTKSTRSSSTRRAHR